MKDKMEKIEGGGGAITLIAVDDKKAAEVLSLFETVLLRWFISV